VYFLEEVLRLGDPDDKTLFSRDTLLLPSSQGITVEVSDNPHAIGYDGLGYVTPNVRVIAVAKDANSSYVLPSSDTVNDGSYPIARDLYMYTAGPPSGVIEEYLNWILSPEAQDVVQSLGFVPIETSG
jgi:phosphate transport system substrate-binding protein